MARAVRWDLIADPKKYQQGFRQAEQTTKKFHGTVTKMAGLIGGAFAAVQVGGFLKDAINEAREAAKVTRQTNAVLKATGGVARVSAKDVEKLATALSNKVGVDDEVIQAGANMLLSFKNVRNEVGKGNDVFNQASKAILDMTAFMHQGEVTQQGLEKSTIAVGKALNNPIAGITALTRVGVTFNDAQKEQIKTLVKSGKTMDAQKIILKELGSEFGGAAEAATDPWQKLSVTFGNTKEAIGNLLLPALENAASFMTDTLIPAAEKWWKVHGPAFRDAFRKINEAVTTFFEGLRDNLEPQLDRIKEAWDDNREAILQLAGVFGNQTDATKQGADAAKSFGDTLVGVIEAAGKASKFLRQLGDALNWLDAQFDKAGKFIHDHFTVPVIDNLKLVGDVFLETWRTNLRVMATVAEKLHLPVASGLRKAEQALTRFKGDFNKTMDGLKNEDVTIDVKGIWVPPKGSNLSIHSIVGKARGGPISGPGTATSDSIPAWLSTGEHVWSAREVQGAGGHAAIERMRRQARGFAAGGAITPHLRLPSADRIGATAGRAIDRLASMIDRLTFNVPIRGNPGILSFIRSVDPLPYIWGGVGPNGYDCSGLVGEVMARHLGLPSYRRYFTTGSIRAGQYGLRAGLGGILDIGVTSGTGHMAGSYMGMGFEAESTRSGIKVGGAASPPGSFARRYHLARGGPVERSVLAAYAGLAGVNLGGDPGRLRINGMGTFDRGGWLRPGFTMAYNGTGRAEPVGINEDRLAAKVGAEVARALRVSPPVVAVDDVHTGLKAKKRRNANMALGLS